MKSLMFSLVLSLGVLPLCLYAAYPNQYKDSRFYQNHGRKIEELEKKSKDKNLKSKQVDRLQKKIEAAKAAHDAAIDREIANLQEQRKDCFAGRKEADLPKFPQWEQEKIKNIDLDLKRLAAFKERKDFKATPIEKKGKDAGKTTKTKDAGKTSEKKGKDAGNK